MQRKVDVWLFVNTKVSLLMVAAALCRSKWAVAKEHLIREGEVLAVLRMQADALASVVRLFMLCLEQMTQDKTLLWPHVAKEAVCSRGLVGAN